MRRTTTRRTFCGSTSPESDQAGVGLCVASKFEDIARNPGAHRIIAPFGQGVSVRRSLELGVPLVVSLSAGRLSRLASGLLGHVLLASAVDYALSRDAANRAPFALYIDEAHRFPATNLVDALAETRKYGCSVIAAHQELSQLDRELRDALLANAGTRVLFRTGLADASALVPATGVPPGDLAGLSDLCAYVQLPGGQAFSVELDAPQDLPELAPYRPPATLARLARPRPRRAAPEAGDCAPAHAACAARRARTLAALQAHPEPGADANVAARDQDGAPS